MLCPISLHQDLQPTSGPAGPPHPVSTLLTIGYREGRQGGVSCGSAKGRLLVTGDEPSIELLVVVWRDAQAAPGAALDPSSGEECAGDRCG